MTITITGDRAHLDGKAVAYKATPNHSGGLAAEGIILHDTAGGLKADGSISWLCNPEANASAHVVIARDGTITQLAPFNVRTWHAGKSRWLGRSNVNGFAVGIEIVNPGKLDKSGTGYVNDLGVKVAGSMDVHWAETKEHGGGYWLTYTEEQIEAVIGLCKALRATYPGIGWIATHYLISPGRKIDVNPLFPLAEVRAAVFDGAPAPITAPAVASGVAAYQAQLIALGYDLGSAGADGVLGRKTKAAVRAFQRDHGLIVDGIVGPNTLDALKVALAPEASAQPAPLPASPPAPAPEPAKVRDALAEFEVRAIQQRLSDLGYSEVGLIDGKWGSRTTGAVAAFQQHEGLPETGDYDDATRARLAEASPREVSPERASTTVADLRQAGSKTVKAADRGKGIAKLLLGLGLAGGSQETGLIESAQQTVDTVTSIRPVVDGAADFLGWVTSHWWIGAIVGGALVWVYFGDVIQRRLIDQITGKHA